MNQSFRFSEKAFGGTPCTMEIVQNGNILHTVLFTSDRLGEWCNYTDVQGTKHEFKFQNGTITLKDLKPKEPEPNY